MRKGSLLAVTLVLAIAIAACTPPVGLFPAGRASGPTRTPRGFVALPTVAPMPDGPPTASAEPAAPATAVPATAVAAPSRTAAMHFGVSLRDEIRDPDVQELVRDLGATHVRTSVRWQDIEPTVGTYRWELFDAHLKLLAGLNVTPVVYVSRNPSWAASSECGVIDRAPLDRFAAFMKALAGRYSGSTVVDGETLPAVNYWQLYNEPDNRWSTGQASGFDGCWGRAGAQYAELMRVAWDAVHSANPQAKLIFGGIAGEQVDCPDSWECAGQAIFNADRNGDDFVDDVLSYIKTHPGSAYFDIFDFHYYPAFGSLWTKWGPGVLGKAAYYRARLAKWGLERPIIVSEIGRRSDASQVIDGVPGSEDEQSRSLVRLLAESAAAGIDTVLWFTMADIVEPSQGGAQGWGLLRDTKRKPSYLAYSTMAKLLAGRPFTRPARLGNGIEGYVFGSADNAVTVAWPKAGPVVVRLQTKQAPVTDVYGNVTIIHDGAAEDGDHTSNGQITFTLSAPTYLGGAW